MKKDVLTEWAHGEGAIKTCGKFLVQQASGSQPILFCGLLTDNILSVEDNWGKGVGGEYYKDEMWEAEIIIIPHRKYTDNITEDTRGLRIDQKLRGQWGLAEHWKNKIFEISP